MSFLSYAYVLIFKCFPTKIRKVACFSHPKFKRLFLALIFFLFSSLILFKRHFSSCDLDSFDFATYRHGQDHKILKVLETFKSGSWHPGSSNGTLDHGWREVYPQLYIYSAYSDECTVGNKSLPCIKVIGAILDGHSFLKSEKKCSLKDSKNGIWDTDLIIEVLPEHHSRYFRSTFFYCILDEQHWNLDFTDFFFKFPNPKWSVSSVWLPINRQNKTMLLSNGLKQGIAVCVRPLFNNFSSPISLSEFIGYYQSLGVDHFIFYNQSISLQLGNYFALLDPSFSTLSLRQWNLPFDTNAIHSEGQLAHINDCLLFSKLYFNYTIFVDLDEFIMPYQHSSLPSLLENLKGVFPKAGSFIIKNVMFCNEFLGKDIAESGNKSLGLITQMNFCRQESFWPHKQRSKVIVKPEAISIGGIHFVWNHLGGEEEALVESSLVSLNHFRECGDIHFEYFLGLLKNTAIQDSIVEDRNMLRFRERFLSSPGLRLLTYLWNKVPK